MSDFREGKILQELFTKHDTCLDLDYLPFDTLTLEQRGNWQKIAEEFQKEANGCAEI